MTEHQGATLGVDLYHLYLIGKAWLPNVADQYDAAMSALLSADSLFGAFSRSSALGGPDGPLREAWLETNRELMVLLSHFYLSLTEAAAGVLRTMEAYAAADAQAHDTLNHLIHDRK